MTLSKVITVIRYTQNQNFTFQTKTVSFRIYPTVKLYGKKHIIYRFWEYNRKSVFDIACMCCL